MKNISLLIIFSIAFTSVIWSQNYKPDWGSKKRIEKGNIKSDFYLLGLENSNYYLINNNYKNGSKLLKYSIDHEMVFDRVIEFENIENVPYIEDIVRTKSNTFCYLSSYNKKERSLSIFSAPFNDGEIGELKNMWKHDFHKKKYYDNDLKYQVIVSKNMEKVAYVNVLNTDSEANNNEEFAIALFDENLNLQWQKIQTFNFPESKIELVQVEVDNDGIIYMLMKHKARNKKILGDEALMYDYFVYSIEKSSLKETPVILEDNLVPTSMQIFTKQEPSKKVFISGLYMPNKIKTGLTGVFYAELMNGELSRINIHEFDNDDAKEAESDPIDEPLSLYTYENVKEGFQFKDGTFGFASERTLDVVDSKTGLYRRNTSDVHIFIFSEDGKLQKITPITKNFYSLSYQYCSFYLEEHDNLVYIVYNHLKTMKELKAEKKKKGKKKKKPATKQVYTKLAIINNSGEKIFDKTIFSKSIVGSAYMPMLSDIDENILLIGSAFIDDFKIGIINLNYQTGE